MAMKLVDAFRYIIAYGINSMEQLKKTWIDKFNIPYIYLIVQLGQFFLAHLQTGGELCVAMEGKRKSFHLDCAFVQSKLAQTVDGVKDIACVNGKVIADPALERRPNRFSLREPLYPPTQALGLFFSLVTGNRTLVLKRLMRRRVIGGG